MTSLWVLGCYKPVIAVVTFLMPPAYNPESQQDLEAPLSCSRLILKIKIEFLPFCSTGGFCPPWAHLRTPVLHFGRCTVPVRLLTCHWPQSSSVFDGFWISSFVTVYEQILASWWYLWWDCWHGSVQEVLEICHQFPVLVFICFCFFLLVFPQCSV